MSLHELALQCVQIAHEAGDAIQAVAQQFTVELKQDSSPVTDADLIAEQIIQKGLKGLHQVGHSYPILSEESFEGFHKPAGRYWCVDPLDGTKDFIHKTGDYTVNIALIDADKPILGVVHAPHSGETYFASPEGAFKLKNGHPERIWVKQGKNKITAIISRFHPDPKLVAALESMPDVELRQQGSAIKLCKIAEGEADVYPRLTPCMIWDIAAAHSILSAAGGEIVSLDQSPLTYDMSAPWKIFGFLAHNDPHKDWKFFLQKIPGCN